MTEKNRISRHMFGKAAEPKSIPDLTGSTVGVTHIGTDIVIHWTSEESIHYVEFNSLFGQAKELIVRKKDEQEEAM